ncbi:glycosyltransferase family protein [Shewanella xiamenensis]|uniref:hypothetical protein n=1 Tax=Shewanella xiamenensis TaxID=332186 RepID=UPI0021BFD97A|nr:hypothetical protein [Shewanella xiamenensis]MCT8864532.1 hypothetical protein [Shewanella xiamenensis]
MGKAVLIYSSSKLYGGTEELFSNVGIGLSSEGYYVDIFESSGNTIIEDTILRRSNCEFSGCFIARDKFSNRIYDIALVSSKDLVSFSKLIKFKNIKVAKVLIWQLQPNELICQFLPFANYVGNKLPSFLVGVYKYIFSQRLRTAREAVKNLTENNALWFMDGANKDSSEDWFDCEFQPNYLPICARFSLSLDLNRRMFDTNELNVYCLGRISSDFKIYPNINLVESLADFASKNKIKIHLKFIGDGDAESKLQNFCEQFNSEYIRFTFYGFKILEQACSLIIQDADVVFAMGTSALNCASCKVPVVLLDAYSSKYNFTEVKYLWLYETSNFSVGRSILKANYFEGKNIAAILTELTSNHKEIAEKCFSYVKMHHSEDSVIARVERSFCKVDCNSELLNEIVNEVVKKQAYIVFFIMNLYGLFKK